MPEDTFRHLAKHIARIEKDVESTSFHGLPLGGRMAYYAVVKDSVELVQAVKAAYDISLPYLVLGQAGSTLIHDDGFEGLVIHNQSRHVAFSAEHSQVVVESGASLQTVIIQAAERGLGGLIHLYGCGGSLGGALYYNSEDGGRSLADSLRSLTMLMPPTRIKPEPSIVRYKGSWLTNKADDGLTRLQTLAKTTSDFNPVILTAQLQLTSLRGDELARRLHAVAQTSKLNQPNGPAYGPLFYDIDGTLAQLFNKAEVAKIKQQGLQLVRTHPNYLTAKNRYIRDNNGKVPLADVRAYMDDIQQQVLAKTGVALIPSFSIR